MNDASPNEAPSLARLVKALVGATALAVVLLALVVLPAEYNVDVTGFGRAIGLTVLSTPKTEVEGSTQLRASTIASPDEKREDETIVELPPGEGLEYKFRVQVNEKMTYAWRSDSDAVFYDFHGEPAGAAKDVFESYAAGRASSVKGTLTAPFDGTHGWYWKNRSTGPIKITLSTSGAYEIVGLR